MGGKRTGTRQRLYICLAGLILLAAPACAPIKAAVCTRESRLPVLQALIDRGQFDKTVTKSEEILSTDRDHTDEALFALGLVYAHVENPRKDYRKSRDYFARLTKDFPASPLAGESKIWVGVLDTIEKTKNVDIEIEGMKKGSSGRKKDRL